MYDDLRKMYADMHTHTDAHIIIYPCMQPHTQSREQPYPTLITDCGTKLTFYLEAIITWPNYIHDN